MNTGVEPACSTAKLATRARSSEVRYAYEPVEPSAVIESTPAPAKRSTRPTNARSSTASSDIGVSGKALRPVNTLRIPTPDPLLPHGRCLVRRTRP